MNKRGISPLIATVLLVAVAIIIAIIVFLFVGDVLEEQTEIQEEEIALVSTSTNFHFTCTKYMLEGNPVYSRVLITNEGSDDLYFIIQLDGVAMDIDGNPGPDYFLVASYESNMFPFNTGSSEVTLIPSLEEGGEPVSVYTETEEVEVLDLTCSDHDGVCDANGRDCSAFPNTEEEILNDVTGCSPGEYCWICDAFDSCSDFGASVTCVADPACEYMEEAVNHGTVDGCPDSCWGTCEWDNTYAVSFDGDGDYISTSDNSNLDIGTGSLSISLWVKSDSYGGATELPVSNGHASAGCTNEVQDGYQIRRTASVYDFLICDFYGNGQTKYARASFGTTADGFWHHIVAVYDRGSDTALIYKDSVFEDSTLIGLGETNLVSVYDISFGGRDATGSFNGQMDDVRIYSTALNQGEVDMLYGGEDVSEGLVSHWKFEQNYEDSMGNNHGASNGDVTWWPS